LAFPHPHVAQLNERPHTKTSMWWEIDPAPRHAQWHAPRRLVVSGRRLTRPRPQSPSYLLISQLYRPSLPLIACFLVTVRLSPITCRRRSLIVSYASLDPLSHPFRCPPSPLAARLLVMRRSPPLACCRLPSPRPPLCHMRLTLALHVLAVLSGSCPFLCLARFVPSRSPPPPPFVSYILAPSRASCSKAWMIPRLGMSRRPDLHQRHRRSDRLIPRLIARHVSKTRPLSTPPPPRSCSRGLSRGPVLLSMPPPPRSYSRLGHGILKSGLVVRLLSFSAQCTVTYHVLELPGLIHLPSRPYITIWIAYLLTHT
jgi:hypothetical protein